MSSSTEVGFQGESFLIRWHPGSELDQGITCQQCGEKIQGGAWEFPEQDHAPSLLCKDCAEKEIVTLLNEIQEGSS